MRGPLQHLGTHRTHGQVISALLFCAVSSGQPAGSMDLEVEEGEGGLWVQDGRVSNAGKPFRPW